MGRSGVEMVDTMNRPHLRLDPVLIASVLVFVTMLVLVETGASFAFDRAIMGAFGSVHTTWLTSFAKGVTFLGSVAGELMVGALVVAWLLGRRERWAALHVIVALVLGALLAFAVKLIVARDRPDVFEWLAEPSGSSFPSGHSASIALTLPLMAWVIAERTRPRLTIEVTAWLLVALVGMSRCYLGVHWPTDVIAGWAVGIGLWRLAMRLAPLPLVTPRPLSRSTERD